MMQDVASAPDPTDETIRKNLVRFRKEAGLSQAEVADLSGVPMNNLSRYERGENGIPSSILPQLARVFGREPGDFFRADPGPPPSQGDLDVYFLRTRPGIAVGDDITAEVLAGLARGNAKHKERAKKIKK